MLIFLATLFILVTIAASVSFFYFNGFFPNYYTLEYFRTEPKSAMVLLRDSVTWIDLLLFSIFGILIFLLFKWVVEKTQISQIGKSLFLFGTIFFLSFGYLVLRHRKYDQCYTMDTNFSASFVRHILELSKERKFEGRGLGYRKPIPLDAERHRTEINVLVILCESLRKQNLGPYGYIETPNLDLFMKTNRSSTFLFEQAYSVSSTTMLAVPAVLSGIGPYQSPELFYSQPLIWDLGRAVGARTFFLSSHTMEWYHFDRYYANEKLDFKWNAETSKQPFFNDLGIDDAFTIKELNRQFNTGDPFFGVVQLNATHYPYRVPEKAVKWKGRFEDEYNNAIRYQDSLLGSVFDQLMKSGKMENTVIVFTSDHGESLKDHNNIGHVDSYYAETISIPLILHVPEKIQQKLNMNTLKSNLKKTVSNIDIAPTLVELLGLKDQFQSKKLLDNYSGYSLFSQIPDNRIVISMNNNEVARFKVGLSIIGQGWHYLHRMNCVPNRQELYFTKWDHKERFDQFGLKGKGILKYFFNLAGKYKECENYLPKKD
jgi:glucan phosphoethanolaminetransferase (alkaline phosphatase superfamily)